ncbi:MAG: hypothetical protein NW223_09570 [Hyphomicrobiaceae bacterium]|nr:hypothetical protein [Hyphomicrobiaceae bacterium]
MSTIAVSSQASAAAAGSEEAAKSFWHKMYDRMIHGQQARAERAVAAYLASHGGLLTDDMEREIMAKFSSNNTMSRVR